MLPEVSDQLLSSVIACQVSGTPSDPGVPGARRPVAVSTKTGTPAPPRILSQLAGFSGLSLQRVLVPRLKPAGKSAKLATRGVSVNADARFAPVGTVIVASLVPCRPDSADCGMITSANVPLVGLMSHQSESVRGAPASPAEPG